MDSNMDVDTNSLTQLSQPIGITPGKKGEGITRILYENVNGLPAKITGNHKLQTALGIIDDLEVDLFALNEHKINFLHKDNRKQGLGKMFHGGETLSRAIGGNLKHPVAKTLGKHIEGGTGLIAYGETASMLRTDLSGMDETGLARWSYMTVTGREGHLTTILVGYNPCRTTGTSIQSSYQLQRAYFTVAKQDHSCPRKKFQQDLIDLLTKWRKEGRRLIVCLDANDHVYTGRLGKAMVDSPGLDLKESMMHTTGIPLTATYFRGSRPIDAVWATPDIDITNICAMPIGFGIGDHRAFIVDISTRSLVGVDPQPIRRPTARRLNTKIPRCADRYNTILEDQLIQHNIIQRLHHAHNNHTSESHLQQQLDAIDRQCTQIMLHAEKKCRKLKSGRIPFSPEASLWIKRTLCYRSLLRYWAGKIRNKGNLNRQAKRCKIAHPFDLSLQTLADRLAECKQKCKYFVQHGHQYRRSHLNTKLNEAKDRQDAIAERRILQIIQTERDKAFWRRLNWALGQRRGGSVQTVQVEEPDGSVIEATTQEEVQELIWEKIHRERYHLAEEAPICQGRLRGEFGYNASTTAATAVLDGTYELPDGEHEGTQQLFQAIARIRQKIPPNSILPVIDTDTWKSTWQRKQESTSSSFSGLHFGHYISGATSDIISEVHAYKTSLALYHGIALTRWKTGLCVMLEKRPGVKLISKLRAILLMEADFNAANKIIFGQRMLQTARHYKVMPDEIFSERQRMADDGILSKTLFYDISRQLRAPAALASVDAANCYDRVAHACASLIFRAFGTPLHPTLSMLSAIQQMQFFLRTAFGDSKRAVGSRVNLRTQGFMQGNGASPAGWTVISITILHAHKEQGHGATFTCPVSQLTKDLSCILYVDDNDIIHLGDNEQDTGKDVLNALQASVNSWGQLLIATGGALKPPKCSFYLLEYTWNKNGQWSYHTPDNPPSITVPLPNGTNEPIKYLSVEQPSVTLGGATSPHNSGKNSLQQMTEKALDWAHNARNSSLRARDLHISVHRKFWPKVKYGLCASTCSWDDLIAAMQRPYYWLAPIGGLLRSARRELRTLDTGFYGLGLPHWGIEALNEAYKKFFLHFGTQSSVGIQLQMSVELFTIELGLSSQPFLSDFTKYSPRITDSFCKSLWERLHQFQFRLVIGKDLLLPPREHDQWLMVEFERIGYSPEDCATLNTVRLHQQAIFLSDVFNADGRTVREEAKYPRLTNQRWSHYKFGKQHPSTKAWNLWRTALQQLAPRGRRDQSLGKFIRNTHRIWIWKYDPTTDLLVQIGDSETTTFRRQESNRRSRHSTYEPTNTITTNTSLFQLCSVSTGPDGRKSIISYTTPPDPTPTTTHFHDLLRKWPNQNIWKTLEYTNDGKWIYDSISQSSLLCVSDGSYIREFHPFLCSAAIIMECTRSGERLTLTFSNRSSTANAFRGELLGLMAIHLILASINETRRNLAGRVQIHSDCMGALKTIQSLPHSRIPPNWKHADILKTIATTTQPLAFTRSFHHVKAHQDDSIKWADLPKPAQLNCECDTLAKQSILSHTDDLGYHPLLPLEPISLIVGQEKITSDSEHMLRYAAQQRLAKEIFSNLNILTNQQFEEVAWEEVHTTLRELPKMFQMFATKQVFGVSAVLANLSKQKKFSHLGEHCPSCSIDRETASHLLSCREDGRINCVNVQIGRISRWLQSNGTTLALSNMIVDFLWTRGTLKHRGYPIPIPPQYSEFITSQTHIGWRRTMEGMVSKTLLHLDRHDVLVPTSHMSVNRWLVGLIKTLLEATHGVWIYRNITIHDSVSGMVATKEKEQLNKEIELQIERGGEGLAEEDRWMVEVNLDNIENSSGERESYWLLAIKAARERYRMQQG
jgi:hypothetical protein